MRAHKSRNTSDLKVGRPVISLEEKIVEDVLEQALYSTFRKYEMIPSDPGAFIYPGPKAV